MPVASAERRGPRRPRAPTITKSTRNHGASAQRSEGGNENENDHEHNHGHNHGTKTEIEIEKKAKNECVPKQRTRRNEGW